MTDLNITEIVVSSLGLVGTLGVAWLAASARKNAKETNDAVNHRHRTGTPRLYDIVINNSRQIGEITTKCAHLGVKLDRVEDKVGTVDDRVHELTEWKRSYDATPMSSGCAVHEWLRRNDKRLDDLEELMKGKQDK